MITEECKNCKGTSKFKENKKYVPCLECEGTGIVESYKLDEEEEIKAEKLEKKRTKTISLWSEGFSVTGQSSDATFHGTFKAKDLRDAIIQFRDSLDDEYSKSYIDLKRKTFWGCKFFDNESDARKSFG